MNGQGGLTYIGRIEQCVLTHPAAGESKAEARRCIEERLGELTRRHGWYRFVAERVARISDLTGELYTDGAQPESPPEVLKLAILKECIALRRYVSRIKT